MLIKSTVFSFVAKTLVTVTVWIDREIVSNYCTEVRQLGFRLQEGIAESLGLDKECIKNVLGEQGQHMAVNYYPPCPEPELTYGLPGHTDPNALTILLQDGNVAGLQVLKDGKWSAVRPHPDAFVINIGDQLQVLHQCVRICFCFCFFLFFQVLLFFSAIFSLTRPWVMGSSKVYGIELSLMLIKQDFQWVPSSVLVTKQSWALQRLSLLMVHRLFTGISPMRNITRSFGAGTWTRNTAWNFSRTKKIMHPFQLMNLLLLGSALSRWYKSSVSQIYPSE